MDEGRRRLQCALFCTATTRVRAAAAPVWGAPFAEEPCRAMLQAARATLWLGPDEYLLLGTDTASEGCGPAEALERSFERDYAACPGQYQSPAICTRGERRPCGHHC